MNRALGGLLLAALIAAPTGEPVAAQQAPSLRVERADGSMTDFPVIQDRGYAAVQLTLFDDLGWTVRESGNEISIGVPNEIDIGLRVGSPFFTWDGIVFQLADAPYREGASALIPLQLLTEFLPTRLPDLYEYDGARTLLRAGDPALIGGQQAEAAPPAPAPLPAGRSTYTGPRVVIIDAGHGGEDPGAISPRGIREKDVALAIALQLATILRRNPNLQVHMIRDSDVFVDLWQRGEIATRLKGDAYGLFVSIHANSIPNQRSTRGFETYFLSEARTEHERRVQAIENAPLSISGGVDPADEPDLDFILRELRNLDHQHWSNLLAELTQDELEDFHPGPNRGVKQGVLAVLTNTLMPSILVETGYLSNDDEARLLAQPDFQANAARAISRAVERFFERYPPGSAPAGGEDR
ncbi:MAG: N-acetylmuramoyl-L-alanine amidase [Gemmatimonadales bacterium]